MNIQDIKIKEDFKKIKVKKQLDFTVKKLIINNIIDGAKIEDSNIIRIDYALLYMFKDIILISQYSNLEIGEDMIADYDYASKKGIIKHILNKIDINELQLIDKIIENEIEQIHKIENSTGNIIAKGLNYLAENLPDEKAMQKVIKEVPKALNKISPEVLSVIKNIKN